MVKGAENTNPFNPAMQTIPSDTQNDLGTVKDVGIRPVASNIGDHRDLKPMKEVKGKTNSQHPPLQVLQAKLSMQIPEKVDILHHTIVQLPENSDEIPPHLAEITQHELEVIQKAYTTEVAPLQGVKDGKRQYDGVLSDLNRLKGRLGGSPVFGNKEPTLNEEDANRTFFGIPMTAVKDWFKMVLKDKWSPQFFWNFVAARFGVRAAAQESQYEHAHLAIQRFGMIMANQERIFNILDSRDSSRYTELYQISGFMFHPDQNTPSIEKDFINLIDQYFTLYYEEAKAKGDDALVEFFRAIGGVCFEGRARALAEYITKHPLAENAKEMEMVANVSDWDSNNSVKEVYNKEVMAVGQAGKIPKPIQIREILEIKDVFKTEFNENGEKKLPTIEGFHIYCLNSINNDIMENYSYQDFLETELAIFKTSGQEQTQENFIAQLTGRLTKIDPIEVHEDDYPSEGNMGNPVAFIVDSDKTKAFIGEALKNGVLS